jgi:microcystin-dependent protein
MPTDAITEHLGIPKPDPANNVDYDFARLILAMEMIDGFIHALQTALAGVAPTDHSHDINDVDGLQAALTALANSIAEVSNTFEGLSDTEVGDASQGMVLQYLNDKWTSVAAKASFFAIDPIAGINSPSVQGALGELQAEIDALLENAPPEFDTLKELADELSSADGRIVEATPPGSVSYFATPTAPSGWLTANGAAISRVAYSDLFSAIGTTFGAGDGSTTFNLPDLRGEFLRAFDNGRGIDPGRTFGSSQGDAMRNFTGTFQIRASATSSVTVVGSSGAITDTNVQASGFVNLAHNSGTTGQQTITLDPSTQVPTASENRPRNIALLACIKY